MLVQEIITNPPRDEYLDNKYSSFDNANTVATIQNLELKKATSDNEIVYGLFDTTQRLVGYFSLEKYKDNIYQVNLVQLAQAYKGQGLGTFFYDYAVMNDKISVLSDATNTGGPHGSKNLWQSLYAKKRYNIVGFDTTTNTIIQDAHPDSIYNEKPNMRWLAIPPGETINEMLTRQQQLTKHRHIVWYGPGTTSETYFNY